jgi:hypothetical protein
VEKIRLIHRSGGVYYHYQFKYLFKLTKTKKRLRVENRPLERQTLPADSNTKAKRRANAKHNRTGQHCSTVFCLQEESGPAGTGGRNDDGVLPAKLAEACKATADLGRSMSSRMQTDKFCSPNACKTISSVEKRLHIHSSKCAEAAFLLAKPFLSKIGSAPVQCFSSSSGST